jgi:biotin carboxyl carrier protein
MIIKVKIDEQIYQVEIQDIQQRPIIAVVDGDEFEIWPEGEPTKPFQTATAERTIGLSSRHEIAAQTPSATPTAPTTEVPICTGITPSAPESNLMMVRAPIPGVITSVDVHVGSEVSVGEQLCVLEAMKMNNSIRSSRAGRISVVHISTGQHVKHHDLLIEYESI